MSEMEKTKRLVIAVLDASRLGNIEKIKLLDNVSTDIKKEFEEIKPGKNKIIDEINKINNVLKNEIAEYWFVCYQIGGFWGIENVVLKDEYPVRYIARKNDGGPKIYCLVNFWKIDQEQYDELSRYVHFLDL